jgi:hypothetical protein
VFFVLDFDKGGPAIKRIIFFLFFLPAFLFAEPLYSPTWGFFLDLPEGYELVGGNNVDRYSFKGPRGVQFDMVVYNGTYSDIAQLAADVSRRLQNTGDTALFTYNDKAAALMELRFGNSAGWGLCLELSGEAGRSPLLVALSYALEKSGMDLYHLSALDSLAPSAAEQRIPGPVMEFTWPRGEYIEAAIAGTGLKTRIREHDAEAAQSLIEREFALLRDYLSAPQWQAAWIRYYRMIYRDSCDRIADAARQLGRAWNSGTPRTFAEKALSFVQGFQYERNLEGSDFVNLVSAVTEGRGDCDSRAMLWAMLLLQADIPAAMMVSRDYSHAMGLIDIGGAGARFEAGGVSWLVAETTSRVTLGLINQEVSNPKSWLAVLFD